MNETTRGAPLVVAVGLALLTGVPARRAAAQASSEASRAKKSVYGKLESVNARLNGVFMTIDDSKRLAWRFEGAARQQVGGRSGPARRVFRVTSRKGSEAAGAA